MSREESKGKQTGGRNNTRGDCAGTVAISSLSLLDTVGPALRVADVAQSKTPIWKTEEIATVGELLLDISINLAKT
jgi:hypothetical protein